jgi:hypothetical protein
MMIMPVMKTSLTKRSLLLQQTIREIIRMGAVRIINTPLVLTSTGKLHSVTEFCVRHNPKE